MIEHNYALVTAQFHTEPDVPVTNGHPSSSIIHVLRRLPVDAFLQRSLTRTSVCHMLIDVLAYGSHYLILMTT